MLTDSTQYIAEHHSFSWLEDSNSRITWVSLSLPLETETSRDSWYVFPLVPVFFSKWNKSDKSNFLMTNNFFNFSLKNTNLYVSMALHIERKVWYYKYTWLNSITYIKWFILIWVVWGNSVLMRIPVSVISELLNIAQMRSYFLSVRGKYKHN